MATLATSGLMAVKSGANIQEIQHSGVGEAEGVSFSSPTEQDFSGGDDSKKKQSRGVPEGQPAVCQTPPVATQNPKASRIKPDAFKAVVEAEDEPIEEEEVDGEVEPAPGLHKAQSCPNAVGGDTPSTSPPTSTGPPTLASPPTRRKQRSLSWPGASNPAITAASSDEETTEISLKFEEPSLAGKGVSLRVHPVNFSK